MSRIIDSLNKHFNMQKNNDDSIRQELAKTFFGAPTKKENKRFGLLKLPWIITSVALLSLFLVLLSRSNIDIKIEITGRAPAKSPTGLQAAYTPVNEEEAFLVKAGQPNEYFVKKAFFFGDALKFSRVKEDMLVLVNSKGMGWSNINLQFIEPMNMSGSALAYTAKGQEGGERIIVVLTDVNNKTYRMPQSLASMLSEKWEDHVINLAPARDVLDLSKISRVSLEFGSITTGNSTYTTIYLEDIYLTKARGEQWL